MGVVAAAVHEHNLFYWRVYSSDTSLWYWWE